MSLNADMIALATALSVSAAFQTWVDADDAAEAAEHIYSMTADRDLATKTVGYNCVVLSPGAGWSRDRRTLGDLFITEPEHTVEFLTLIAKSTTDQALFAALLTDMSGIMSDLEAQNVYNIDATTFAGEDTPSRAPHSSGTFDWASITLVLTGNPWQDNI